MATAASQACINHAQEPSLAKSGPRPLGGVMLGSSASDVRRLTVTPERDFAAEAKRHAAYLDYVREFEARGGRDATYAETINYSAALMHTGRAARAVEVLIALEAKQPGTYMTAANLGTAYELTGQFEDALTWIGKGIERDPASHAGTEWLHLAILQAKLRLRDDAAWLDTHSVLDGHAARSSAEIVRAIEYQLGERLQFVKPADPVVCDLFYQAAVRVTGDRTAERRAHFLRESLRFGPWRKAEVEKRLKS